MPTARTIMSSPDSTAAKLSLDPDARRWRLEALSELLGGEKESYERFRLRFGVKAREKRKYLLQLHDLSIAKYGTFSRRELGGGLRRYSLLSRKLECQTHFSFSVSESLSDSGIPDDGERGLHA